MAVIKVGCCGFPGGMGKYLKEFDLAEIQSTFYKLPKEDTAAKWREEAPQKFEFTLKAWQAITHPLTSPTWKKAGIKVRPADIAKYGHLRPTNEVFAAWKETKKIADILKAKIIVIQCPPSFSCTKENIENARGFFSSIEREGIRIAWEPRGDWLKKTEEVARVCNEFDLIHAVDIFWDKSLSKHPISYIRLHGLEKRYNYRYVYTNQDLKKLFEKVRELEKEGKEEIYVLFNNLAMADNAKQFIDLCRK